MKIKRPLVALFIITMGCNISNAQFTDFKNYPVTTAPHESPDSARGHFWGYMFGSYYTKLHADTLGRGNTQYSNLPKGSNAFSMQRLYLGYDYFFNKQFSVHVVLAHEETSDASFGAVTSLTNYQRTFYLKYANVEWDNIFNTGLILTAGSIITPSFGITEEPFWGYRSIDRTIMDMKSNMNANVDPVGANSNDFGANLGGKIWSEKDAGTEKACVGFNFMVGNSLGAIPDNGGITSGYTVWKKYYGDLYVKLLNDKLVLDLYGDGHTFSWAPIPSSDRELHQYEVTGRIFLGYKTKNFNIGAEYFKQVNKNMIGEVSGEGIPVQGDTTDDVQTGFSVLGAAVLLRDKKTDAPKISVYARYDAYNPQVNYNPAITYNSSSFTINGVNYNLVNSWVESYFVVGFDYQPIKQIHFMPNIWFDGIHDRSYNDIPATPLQKYDYDLVARITFYYQFFKN